MRNNIRKIIFISGVILLASTCFTSCFSSRNSARKKELKERQKIVEFAKKHIDIPYCYEGKTKKCFDEAGFTCFVFKKFDIGLPSVLEMQAQVGKSVKRSKAQIGDLIFFEEEKKSKDVAHVGIIISASKNEIVFIHCSDDDGVTVNTLNQQYFKSRLLEIRTLIY